MASRRSFLQGLAALAVSSPLAEPRAQGAAEPPADPFGLGIASGYPGPRGVVLWTRLVGAVSASPVTVRWEVAADEGMRRVVAGGETVAEPQWAHSVHVEVDGLQPDRWYWYRFRTREAESAIGRTRTAPAPGTPAARLRFAVAACQQYEHGYYAAYRHMAADAPDLVVFLGDYIYEATWGRELLRSHGAPEAFTLADYRARYALYKSDPDLQAMHAACPWIVTWDDHEVVNDYAADRGSAFVEPAEFFLRRAAAYQAFYEHMPLPARMRPSRGALPLHCALDWGTLARFCMLDDRQYRAQHACPQPRRRGGGSTRVDVEACPDLAAPERSLLGWPQERWLEGVLAASPAHWNVLAQQTRMAQWDQRPGSGRNAWTDGWDGYPAARRRLLELLGEGRARNPVVLGGDIHAFHVAELKPDFDDPASAAVAAEFVTTSISSYGPSYERLQAALPENPHVLLADGRYRGYLRVDLVPGLWRADLRAMDHVRSRDAPCRTLASYVLEDARPRPQRL
ncbi:MAG TPA: alkaline phosphatase D family protein [Burkholderiales bacterium]|nr:alkaline phosphatase D family protein [Burkholderiales bacterium]